MLLSGQEVEVEVVAEKVTASLNQVTGAEDLKLFNAERITPNNPTNNFHHQAWSTTGSIGIGLDGKINPSITPVFERDGIRSSIILSRDLFEGMNMLHDWLEKTFKEDSTILPKEDFIKPIKEEKPEHTTSEILKSNDEKIKRIEELDSELMADPQAKQYLGQGNEARKLVLLNWIDKLKQEKGITTREAFEIIWPKLLRAEQQMPYKMHKAALPAVVAVGIAGIRACMASPACASLAFALSASVAHKLGEMTKPTFEKIISTYKSGKLENWFKKSGDTTTLDKQTPKKQKVKDQSGATPPAPGLDPDEDNWKPEKKEWKIEQYDRVEYSDKHHAKYYRDPKAVSENGKRLWWSKDNAGHGGAATNKSPSTWKVYEETSEGLKWYKDVDKWGQYISGKTKSKFGNFIPWKYLRGVHDPKIIKVK